MRIIRTKTKYLRCDLSGTLPIGEPEVSISEEVVTIMTKYRYLGSIIQSNEHIDGDVTRIQVRLAQVASSHCGAM